MTIEKQKKRFSQAYSKYYQPLKKMLIKLGFNSTEADDITQETFIRAWHSDNKIKTANYATWVTQVAINLAYEDKIARQDQVFCHEEYEYEAFHARLPSNPAYHFEKKDLLDRTKKASQKLPPIARHALELTAAGIKQKDIASILQIPQGTVKSKVSYARRELASLVFGTRNPFYDSDSI